MKVSILSMQRIVNYGSFLQAYGLKHILTQLGYDVEFADYKVEPCIVKKAEAQESEIAQWKEKLFRLENAFKCIAYRIPFDQHKQFYRKYDNEYLSLLGISSERNERPVTDVLVVGSDEVFNCIQANPNVGFSLELFGKNSNAKKIISYAASFGNTGIKELEQYGVQSQIGKLLNNFTDISVRDSNSEQIVEMLINKVPRKHLDPVLIYNYTKEVELCNCNMPFNDYMVIYAYSGRITVEEGKQIRKFARKLNLKIVAVGGEHKFCDVSIYPNPFEVLAIIKKARYVVTDTFHGTVFSIKFNKQFGTLIRKGNGETYGNYEKLYDLLETFSLNSREIVDINLLEQTLKSPIDYNRVNEIIKYNRKRTIDYFKEVI